MQLPSSPPRGCNTDNREGDLIMVNISIDSFERLRNIENSLTVVSYAINTEIDRDIVSAEITVISLRIKAILDNLEKEQE